MNKVIVSASITGEETTPVLRAEVNKLCLERNIDGDEVWNEIMSKQSFPDIQKVLKSYFNNDLKLI